MTSCSAFDALELSTENSSHDLVTLTSSCPCPNDAAESGRQLQHTAAAESIAPWYRRIPKTKSRDFIDPQEREVSIALIDV